MLTSFQGSSQKASYPGHKPRKQTPGDRTDDPRTPAVHKCPLSWQIEGAINIDEYVTPSTTPVGHAMAQEC
jgi:hypothetical protein